jgi:hypothetical protein
LTVPRARNVDTCIILARLTLTGRTFINIRASRHGISFKSALAGASAIGKIRVGATRSAPNRRAVAAFALRGIATSQCVAGKASVAATFIAVVGRILSARLAFEPTRYITARLARTGARLRTTRLVAQVGAFRVGTSTAPLGAIHHKAFIDIGASFEPISFISGRAQTLAFDRDGIGAARLAREGSGRVDACLVGTHCK